MITAGLARERATRAIKKDTYYKIEEAVDAAAKKGCLETLIVLTEDECCDALIDDLKLTYGYTVVLSYSDVIENDGLLKINMKLKW